MIRVLNILGKEPAGGAEAMALNFQKGFTNEIQAEYLVFCQKKDTVFNENVRRAGALLHSFPDLTLSNYGRIVKRLKKLFRNNKYDIVHLHSPVLGFLCLRIAKQSRVPVRIIHYHSSEKAEQSGKVLRNAILYRLGALYATHFIACSSLAARSAPGNAKVKVIYNGIDCEKFQFRCEKRKLLRKKLGYEDKIIIGNIGRLCFQKNQIFLLDVFEEVCRFHDNCILLIAGDGPLRDELMKYSRGKAYEKKIVFLGNSDHIPELLSAMDVFVLTSIYEGMPLSALEAQASGLPCVLSTRITREASVLDSNIFIGLKKEKSLWARAILCMAKVSKENRSDAYLQMREKGFDIAGASGNLERYYKEIVGECYVSKNRKQVS